MAWSWITPGTKTCSYRLASQNICNVDGTSVGFTVTLFKVRWQWDIYYNLCWGMVSLCPCCHITHIWYMSAGLKLKQSCWYRHHCYCINMSWKIKIQSDPQYFHSDDWIVTLQNTKCFCLLSSVILDAVQTGWYSATKHGTTSQKCVILIIKVKEPVISCHHTSIQIYIFFNRVAV
jgi:hypothetical protein